MNDASHTMCREFEFVTNKKKYKAKEYFHQNILMRTNIKVKDHMHL